MRLINPRMTQGKRIIREVNIKSVLIRHSGRALAFIHRLISRITGAIAIKRKISLSG